MEILEIHSKNFLIKWVQAPDDCIIDWQVKPLKRSVNFALYKKGISGGSSSSILDNLGPGNSPRIQEEAVYPSSAPSDQRGSSTKDSSDSFKVNSGTNGDGDLNAIASQNASESSISTVNFQKSGNFKVKNRQNSFSNSLSKSDLHMVKDYNKLLADELVHGKYNVDKGGMFAFVFDNSFSKTNSKKVLFSSKILLQNKDSRRILRRASTSQTRLTESMKVSKNSLQKARSNIGSDNTLQSVLLKRRRKKLQGFVKRTFMLDFTYGVLSYFRVKDNKLRGQMPVRSSIITVNPRSREIIIDSGVEVWELKALNSTDFDKWVKAFNKIKISQYSLDSTNRDSGEEVDYNLVFRELELVSSKLNKLKFRTNFSSELLLSNISSISDEVELVLDKLKVVGKPISKEEDDLSLSSTSDFYDAKDYFEAFGSGVNIIDKINDDPLSKVGYFETDSQEGLDTITPTSSVSSSDSNEEKSSTSIAEDLQGINKIIAAKASEEHDLYPLPLEPIKRDSDIPVCDHVPPSLISILRKNVGKDMTSTSMPVSLNEPLSGLQKSSEMFEYTDLIKHALEIDLSDKTGERILRIAAFALSYLSSMRLKERNIRKPFNPLLGETFELVREDLGFRLISEKVSHRPLVFAIFVESSAWTLSFSPRPTQKFWGKNFEVITDGVCRLTIKDTGEVFTWTQPSTQLKNLIAGEKYSEPVGHLTVKSSTGYKAVVEFSKAGMFGGRSEDLTIKAYGPQKNELPSSVFGKWTESLTLKTKTTEKLIWTVGEVVVDAEKKFGFTKFAGTLNKISSIEKGKIAPTDSRLRPDIKLYERCKVKEAEVIKARLEQEQRDRRKKLEDENKDYEPIFFEQVGGKGNENGEWIYKTGRKSYWERRKNSDWDDILDLYQ